MDHCPFLWTTAHSYGPETKHYKVIALYKVMQSNNILFGKSSKYLKSQTSVPRDCAYISIQCRLMHKPDQVHIFPCLTEHVCLCVSLYAFLCLFLIVQWICRGLWEKHFLVKLSLFVCLFELILYVPVNNFSVMLRQVFLGWTSTKQG